ncbi:MAG: class I SAM-dependent methyltransferase [Bacteroidetes bacterium]|nr:class I SAM-dependent methyltransferase [Bacteroidota bacterium]
MNRLNIIQQLINTIAAKTYLEIGVRNANIIHRIQAPDKIGVDPAISFSKKMLIKKRLGLLDFKMIEVESDVFFSQYANTLFDSQGIDVAFVDGLHEYQQAFRDVNNCLQYLNDGGVIIMHDCNPLNYAGAYPIKKSFDELTELVKAGQIPGWNDCWNGDVWKALVRLRIEHDDLNIFTLDLDWGLGIITKGRGEQIKNLSVEELNSADYYLLEARRKDLLNLQTLSCFKDFLANLSRIETL